MSSFPRVLNQAAHPTQRQSDGSKHSGHVQLCQGGGPMHGKRNPPLPSVQMQKLGAVAQCERAVLCCVVVNPGELRDLGPCLLLLLAVLFPCVVLLCAVCCVLCVDSAFPCCVIMCRAVLVLLLLVSHKLAGGWCNRDVHQDFQRAQLEMVFFIQVFGTFGVKCFSCITTLFLITRCGHVARMAVIDLMRERETSRLFVHKKHGVAAEAVERGMFVMPRSTFQGLEVAPLPTTEACTGKAGQFIHARCPLFLVLQCSDMDCGFRARALEQQCCPEIDVGLEWRARRIWLHWKYSCFHCVASRAVQGSEHQRIFAHHHPDSRAHRDTSHRHCVGSSRCSRCQVRANADSWVTDMTACRRSRHPAVQDRCAPSNVRYVTTPWRHAVGSGVQTWRAVSSHNACSTVVVDDKLTSRRQLHCKPPAECSLHLAVICYTVAHKPS